MDEVLIKAAELLDESDWYRAYEVVFLGEKRYLCLVSAINRSYCQSSSDDIHLGGLVHYHQRVAKFLNLPFDENSQGYVASIEATEALIQWNDGVAQSKEEVIKVLREAAESSDE